MTRISQKDSTHLGKLSEARQILIRALLQSGVSVERIIQISAAGKSIVKWEFSHEGKTKAVKQADITPFGVAAAFGYFKKCRNRKRMWAALGQELHKISLGEDL